MTQWHIPLSDLDFGPEESAAVARVVASNWLSMGPEVTEFEREFADMTRSKYAFAVSSATAGLHLALLAAQVGPGVEVIQPALNFVATANMTIACGATPVLADIVSPLEPTIDPREVEALITPRTRVVVAMHFGGNMCRMAELNTLCARHNLILIEDACHAIGAEYPASPAAGQRTKAAGAIGAMGTFSFFANKNMTTGEGGMLVTDRDDFASAVKLLRSHGMTTLTWDRHRGHAAMYDIARHGYNYRLDELHAALGRVQLSKLMPNNERRRAILRTYREGLRQKRGWAMPFSEAVDQSAGHLMVALASNPDMKKEARIRLSNARIQSSLHYPCIADFSAFRSMRHVELPHTRDFVSRAITLPLFPSLSRENVSEILGLLV